jgi:hypothetical protein
MHRSTILSIALWRNPFSRPLAPQIDFESDPRHAHRRRLRAQLAYPIVGGSVSMYFDNNADFTFNAGTTIRSSSGSAPTVP